VLAGANILRLPGVCVTGTRLSSSYRPLTMVVLQPTLLLALLLACLLPCGTSFLQALAPPAGTLQRRMTSKTMVTPLRMAKETATTTTSKPATLTQDTTWKLRIVLRGVSTAKGKKVDELFVVSGSFLEEEGYEPPQGSFVQQQKEDGDSNGESSSGLKIVNSRWQLSEDPNDRKDGLWVWGLFKEPLYPFLLLKLETEALPLSGSDEDSILPLQLFAQVNHRRAGDDNGAVILEGTTDLKVRQMETVQADPFGGATVDIYEEKSVGSLSIQPVVSAAASQ